MTPDGQKKTVGLENQAKQWHTPRAIYGEHPGMTDPSHLTGQAINCSTPRASDGEKGGPNQSFGAGGVPLPSQAINWPTPAARDWKSDHGQKTDAELYGTKGAPLSRVASCRFSPLGQTIRHGRNTHLDCFRRYRATTSLHLRSERRALLRMAILSHGRGWTRRRPAAYVRPSFRRQLNPSFVELLMGWPIGWTDCGRAVTGFAPWLRRMRGALSALISMAAEEPAQQELF